MSSKCERYGKSIPRDRLKGEFERLLECLEPSQTLFRIARGMFNNLWNRSTERDQEAAKSAKAKLRQIDAKIGPLMDRLNAESKTVVKVCERKISQLEVGK